MWTSSCSAICTKSIFDAIILKPFYQREYRFTVAEESALIESVLVGIPIPPIFLSSTRFHEVQVLDVVDGQHRLTAFYRFCKEEFSLCGLTLLRELNGLKFSDLELEQQERLYSYTLAAYVFRDFPGKNLNWKYFADTIREQNHFRHKRFVMLYIARRIMNTLISL